MSTLILVLVGIAVMYYVYQSSQTTAAVAKEHQEPIPEDGIKAIEYFWRPG